MAIRPDSQPLPNTDCFGYITHDPFLDGLKEEMPLFSLCKFLMAQTSDLAAQQAARQCQESNYDGRVLSEIKTLDLSSCKLTALPLGIGLLTNLRELRVVNNALTDLPESMTNLTLLNTLHLEGNALKSVPQPVLQSPSLTGVYLYGNDELREIPVALQEKIKSRPPYAKWSDAESTHVEPQGEASDPLEAVTKKPRVQAEDDVLVSILVKVNDVQAFRQLPGVVFTGSCIPSENNCWIVTAKAPSNQVNHIRSQPYVVSLQSKLGRLHPCGSFQ